MVTAAFVGSASAAAASSSMSDNRGWLTGGAGSDGEPDGTV